MEDELADNSDNEKRLSRTDAQAGKRLKSAALKGGKNAAKKPGLRKSNFMGLRYSCQQQ